LVDLIRGVGVERVVELRPALFVVSRPAFDGIETVYKEAYKLRRAIRENDPNSAEWEAEAINVYERPGWKVKLRAWSLCRSTPTHFVCSETFEAWDGERSIFSRSWEKKITRELV